MDSPSSKSNATFDHPYQVLSSAGWKLQADWKIALDKSAQHRVHPYTGLVGHALNAFMGGFAIELSTALYLYCYHANKSPQWRAAVLTILTSQEVRHAYARIVNSELSDWNCAFDKFSWLDQEQKAEDTRFLYTPLVGWASDRAAKMNVHSELLDGLKTCGNLRQRTLDLLGASPPASKASPSFVKIKTTLDSFCELYMMYEDTTTPMQPMESHERPQQALFNDLLHTALSCIRSTGYKARLPPTLKTKSTSYIEVGEFAKLEWLGSQMLPRFIVEIMKKHGKCINKDTISMFVKVLTCPQVLSAFMASLGYIDAELSSQPVPQASESYFRVLAAISYLISQGPEFSEWMTDFAVPIIWQLEAQYEDHCLSGLFGLSWPPRNDLYDPSSDDAECDTTLVDEASVFSMKLNKENEVITTLCSYIQAQHFGYFVAFILGVVLATSFLHVIPASHGSLGVSQPIHAFENFPASYFLKL